MRLPDRDRSSALLIAGRGTDLMRIHALRDALTIRCSAASRRPLGAAGAPPDDAQLAIRWPGLLGTLSRDHASALDRLETTAGDDDHSTWDQLLTELGWTASPRTVDLRAFLAQGPRISQIAHLVL